MLRHTTLFLCVLTAIVYNSWPLGYALNYPVVRYGLASDLDAAHQPYNWLFILGDIITGLVVIGAVALMSRQSWAGSGRSRNVALGGLVVFGIFTAVSALLPLDCSHAGTKYCGSALSQAFGPHDVTGGIAAFGIFLGLVGAGWFSELRRQPKAYWAWVARSMLVVWTVSGVLYLTMAIRHTDVQSSQQIFLILSGLAIVSIGLRAWSFERVHS